MFSLGDDYSTLAVIRSLMKIFISLRSGRQSISLLDPAHSLHNCVFQKENTIKYLLCTHLDQNGAIILHYRNNEYVKMS